MGSGRILAIGTVFVTVVAAGETSCPAACTCPSLYRADCCNASLTHIPRNLISDVRFLNASGNNFISLNKGAFVVHDIKIMDVSSNRISTIENDAMRELEQLMFLYLSRNEIVSLDQTVFRMNQRLEFLKLDNNNLNVPVGRAFLDIPSLKSLDISSCGIKSLAEETFVKLPSLEELRLANNSLKTLHHKVFLPLKSLKYLYLSHNLLISLHENLFFMLRNLVVLDLSNNKLAALHPQVFTFLESVELLKLSGNRLKTLDLDVFIPLISLEELYLDNNAVNVLIGRQSSSELNSLALLDISGNHLDNFQLGVICYLKNLKYLKVSGNQLTCDCTMWGLWEWMTERDARLIFRCTDPGFGFPVNSFEYFSQNTSCNVTFCDINSVTELPEEILSPVYLYVIFSASVLLLSFACGVTLFLVIRYCKNFYKPRSIHGNVSPHPQSTTSPVWNQHNERAASTRCDEVPGEMHRHERSSRNLVNTGHSVSLKALTTVDSRNIRHSYHEYCVPSDLEQSGDGALPSNNSSSVYLHVAPELETRKDRSVSEPKLKVCRRELANGSGLQKPINPLSVSSHECPTSMRVPRYKNVPHILPLEPEYATIVERL